MLFEKPNSEYELLKLVEEYMRSLMYHTLKPDVLISDYALSVAVNMLDAYAEEVSERQIAEALAYGKYMHVDWQTFSYPYFISRLPPIISYHRVTAFPYKFYWEDLFRFQDMEQNGLCNIESTLKRHKLL